jgi:hypothetical protein
VLSVHDPVAAEYLRQANRLEQRVIAANCEDNRRAAALLKVSFVLRHVPGQQHQPQSAREETAVIRWGAQRSSAPWAVIAAGAADLDWHPSLKTLGPGLGSRCPQSIDVDSAGRPRSRPLRGSVHMTATDIPFDTLKDPPESARTWLISGLNYIAISMTYEFAVLF